MQTIQLHEEVGLGACARGTRVLVLEEQRLLATPASGTDSANVAGTIILPILHASMAAH